jgi:hypothetical protein
MTDWFLWSSHEACLFCAKKQLALTKVKHNAIPETVIHPQNVQLHKIQLQNVQLHKTSIYKTSSYRMSRLQNVQVTKRPFYKTSRLQNVQDTKRPVFVNLKTCIKKPFFSKYVRNCILARTEFETPWMDSIKQDPRQLSACPLVTDD